MKEKLERYYQDYNKRSYVHPDPLEFLYRYSAPSDIEITGLIASCLAFGRVSQILKSVSELLDTMDNRPTDYIRTVSKKEMASDLKEFRYRFVGNNEITALFVTIKQILSDFETIENAFIEGISEKDETVLTGLHRFDHLTRKISGDTTGYLFADPLKGSGCKRFNLFLRWMVRKDDVDPGIWTEIPPSKLIVPVDTHMLKIATKLGLTKRKQGNMKTAIEITSGFARFAPEDPVRYDFALTRFGIRGEMSIDEL